MARSVAAVESTPELRQHWQQEFLRNMMAGAIGAGRISGQRRRGLGDLDQLFVQPIADASYGLDGQGVPTKAPSQAGEIVAPRRWGGLQLLQSAPLKGAAVNGIGSDASGPCTFMDILTPHCTVMAAVRAVGRRWAS